MIVVIAIMIVLMIATAIIFSPAPRMMGVGVPKILLAAIQVSGKGGSERHI